MNGDQDGGSSEIALVTGAGKGIGRAIAVSLAQTGRYVYINYLKSKASAEETLDEIESFGGRGKLILFDVADQTASETAVKSILKAHGKIDVLVNNAGITQDKLMVMMKKESWQSVMDVNLTGFYNVTRLVVKNMLKNQYGRIVNITSTSGQTGNAGQVNYSASKAGLIGATKALSKEIASRNITVNAVAPGFIQTEMVANLPLDDIADTIPMKRVGTPDEVAAAVLFFCSKETAYITGQVLGVNGGLI